MSGELREIGPSIALPGSPKAALAARVAADLAADVIACACPHPATASVLFLPAGVLCCADCTEAVRETAGVQPPACAICATEATRSSAWMAGPVLVWARLCDACGTAGDTPAPSLN